MSVTVAKFGGSSLANAEQMKKVKNIVLSDKKYHYVVVSAPGKQYSSDSKITDLLYLCHAHVKYSVPFNELFDIIKNRFISIVNELELSIDIGLYLEEIRQKINENASAD